METTLAEEAKPLDESGILSWVHFGDLHITNEDKQNYRDFRALIADANAHLIGPAGVNFAVLPGDNADDGTEAQFRLVRRAVDRLRFPVHILPGDHDIKSGTLDDFQRHLRAGPLPHAFALGAYDCIFLNSVDSGSKEGFGHSREQLAWLTNELAPAADIGRRAVLFMHTYPSELGENAVAVCELVRRHRVLVVDTGHTHYNEIANDGHTIYAATRSTGQIEEGPAGFSLATLDAGVVSWKFKALEQKWPLVLITSPADELFITDPDSSRQVVRGAVEVRAKIWSDAGLKCASWRVDDGPPQPMTPLGETGVWQAAWDSSLGCDGRHRLAVCAESAGQAAAEDTITVLTRQSGRYDPPPRQSVDHANAIGAYAGKGIIGTQLGPNKNGRKW